VIILGTRKSRLALIQAEEIRARIKGDVSIKIIKSSGDRFLKPLNEFEGKGIFVKEIEEELLNGNIDLAVHSMKDIPTEEREGLEISAVCKRLSPFDALVSKDKLPLLSLPKGARIGTGSIRRRLSIQRIRQDFEFVPIRGNITTRLKMVEDGKLDAIIVAEAGLIRLSLSNLIGEIISEDILLPSPGQGSIGIQIRRDDKRIKELTSPLNDKESEACIKAERLFLSFFGKGCLSGIGALARIKNGKILLKGSIFEGERRIEGEEQGDSPIDVSYKLAEKIKCQI